jgi:hypothetical protein
MERVRVPVRGMARVRVPVRGMARAREGVASHREKRLCCSSNVEVQNVVVLM